MGSVNNPQLGQLSDVSDLMALAHLAAMYRRGSTPYKIFPVLGAVGAHPFIVLGSQDSRRVHRLLHIGFRHDCLLSQPSTEVWERATWPPKQFVLSHGSDHPLPRTTYLTLPDATYLLGLLRLLSAAYREEVRFLRSEESRKLLPELNIAKSSRLDSSILSQIADTYAGVLNENPVQPILGGNSHEFTLDLCGRAHGLATDALSTIDIELFNPAEFVCSSIETKVAKGRKKAVRPTSSLPLKNRVTDLRLDTYERMNLESFEIMIEFCARMGQAFDTAATIHNQRFPDWNDALLTVCRLNA